jgi:hypothetical protein
MDRAGTGRRFEPGAGAAGCLFCLMLAMASMAGCADPQITKSWARREENRQQLLRELAKRERQHEQHLSEVNTFIERRLADDARQTRDNRRVLDELWQQEFHRWSQREPAYRQAVEEQLAGDEDGVLEAWRLILE